MHKRTFIDYFILYLKGIGMGTANKIPGVSGGMIALVSGFYEELIYSFQKLNLKALRLLFNGRFRSFFKYVNIKFLLAVNIGSLSAFFSISLLIDYLIRSKVEGGMGMQTEVWSFFFGLIIGSALYISDKITFWKPKVYLSILLGSALGLYISFIDPLAPNNNVWFIFLCGIISVSGMTLPGFSGSFALIILGNYNLLLVDAVNNLFFTISAIFDGDWAMLGTESFVGRAKRVKMLQDVLVFGVGSLVGLVTFSKIMGFLLKHYHDLVIGALMGFIIGSLGAAWPWKTPIINNDLDLMGYTRYMPEAFSTDFWIQISCIIIGILSILSIQYVEKRSIAKRYIRINRKKD